MKVELGKNYIEGKVFSTKIPESHAGKFVGEELYRRERKIGCLFSKSASSLLGKNYIEGKVYFR